MDLISYNLVEPVLVSSPKVKIIDYAVTLTFTQHGMVRIG